MMKKYLVSGAFALGFPIILIAIWYFLTLSNENPFVPGPLQLVATFTQTWSGSTFVRDVVPSLLRLLFGLLGGVGVGVGIGVLIGLNRPLRSLLGPLLEFFRALPPPVLVPVLILLMGVGDAMKIAVILLGCMWPTLLNSVDGVRSIDPVLRETSQSYGIRGWREFWHLTLPAATPRIMTGIRQSLSIGLILLVVAEMFAASSGIGYQVVLFQRTFRIPEMWSGIALLGIIGIILAFIFKQIQRVVLGWYHGLKAVANHGG